MTVKFVNVKHEPVTIHSKNGMHSARFEARKAQEIPDCLEEAALAKGLIPAEVLEDPQLRLEREQEEAAKRAAEEEEAKKLAEAQRKEALAIAAEQAKKEADAAELKAKRSEAAKKAAATKKANQDKKRTQLAAE